MLCVTPTLSTLIWLLAYCMQQHAHMADVCAICNGDVIHGTGKTKRLRLFRDSVANMREQLNVFLYHELAFAWKIQF